MTDHPQVRPVDAYRGSRATVGEVAAPKQMEKPAEAAAEPSRRPRRRRRLLEASKHRPSP